MAHPIYHLDLSAVRCRVEVLLNGFPVAELASADEQPSWFAPPINPYLVGELNMVDVRILPVVAPDGSASSFWDAAVTGSVRRYEKGDIVAPGEGPEVAAIAIPDELKEQVRDEELELPQSFTVVFANDVLDFSDELSDAPPYGDRDALLAYGIQLRDLAAAGDVSGLLAQFAPKIDVWVAAYDEPRQAFEDSLRQELTELIAEGLITDFDADALTLSSYCGGRIWEIRRGAEPLLQTDVLEDGSRSEMRVFVAPRGGDLRIVR